MRQHTQPADAGRAAGSVEPGRPGRGRRSGRPARARRRVAWSAAGVGPLGLAVLLGPWLWVRWYSHGLRAARLPDVPSAPVALVLGAKVEPDGTPSPFLARRLDLAAALYRQGTVRAVLASGDNGSRRYDEVGAMVRYLVAHGVPARRVVGDHAGFQTWDSCVRAREVFGVRRAVVVTQAFHLPRALALCRRAGLSVTGIGDDSARTDPARTFSLQAREALADVKAVWTVLRRPPPRFARPAEPGVHDALR